MSFSFAKSMPLMIEHRTWWNFILNVYYWSPLTNNPFIIYNIEFQWKKYEEWQFIGNLLIIQFIINQRCTLNIREDNIKLGS